jgi:hypothetical protein
MKNRNFPWAIIAAAAVAGAGFAGVASYVRHEQVDPSLFAKNPDGTQGTKVENDALSGGNNASESNGSTNSESTQVVRASKVDALNNAIKADFSQKGIRVLDVTIENGNAIVDMNNAVRYNWGSVEESAFIKLMSDTMSKFDSINTFQIRVDGEILKYLSHFEVDPVKVR